jgi:hypothetical protein
MSRFNDYRVVILTRFRPKDKVIDNFHFDDYFMKMFPLLYKYFYGSTVDTKYCSTVRYLYNSTVKVTSSQFCSVGEGKPLDKDSTIFGKNSPSD